ncbi:MAG: homoserine dehydrogenase [Oscillospiraceae bacterium]|nr:homoserine dehydrogenase [Oscillospiraceae bacterium]
MAAVAVVGYGTVGSGVVEIIETHREMLLKKTGKNVYVKYIVDIRDFENDPYQDKLVKDFSIVENDPEVETVVEAIGGRNKAYEFTRRALAAGKNVVTSNKELVAYHAVELFELARENNVRYMFEASVGGGIPVIRPMSQCLAANEITEISGILNGTTNYILTRMITASLSFEDALKEAQALGYAEADPAADILGHDACRKICILASLAFGKQILPEDVRIEGITNISSEDIAFASTKDCRIKLLGRAKKLEDGKLYVSVSPFLIPLSCPLSTIDGVFNGVMVHGDSVDDVMFYGRGAGKLPTASAVVADVIDTLRTCGDDRRIEWVAGGSETVSDCRKVSHKYMVRVKGNVSAAMEAAEKLFGKIEVLSCPSLCQCNGAFITSEIPEQELLNKVEELKAAGVEVKNHLMLM